jgi:predicted phage baseplate assembly protein
VTRLTLDKNSGFEKFNIRKTVVFAESEQLALAPEPIKEAVSGRDIELDTFVNGLFAQQKIIICGELDKMHGVSACELATIEKVEQVLETEGHTRITLGDPLARDYVRDTVTINANVALATHGETVQGTPDGEGEVLGSGDAGQVFQRFTLRQPPLTYMSAATLTGAQTTLEVRVNDLRWHEVPSFYGHGPEERIYVTRTNDGGKTTVIFGDGKTGARLPTGQENVRAKYRKGIGLAGLVKANQISELLTRPLGVRSVTNPMAPSGAGDPENLVDARRNSPLTVLTLGRIVSLQDYEDFARAFAGIDKALASWAWNGEKRVVFVTVAGAKGAEVKSSSPLYENLLKAMREAGDPAVPLQVESYVPSLFRLEAAAKVNPDYLPEKVLAAIEQKLRESFSFEARNFGQPVNLSEVIAIMHAVPGVLAVDVNAFYRGETADLKPRLEARRPRSTGDGELFAAELLTLDPRPLSLEEMR